MSFSAAYSGYWSTKRVQACLAIASLAHVALDQADEARARLAAFEEVVADAPELASPRVRRLEQQARRALEALAK